MKEQLVEMTGLSPRVIRVWFQNKRCKDKKRSMLLKQIQQHHQEAVSINHLLSHFWQETVVDMRHHSKISGWAKSLPPPPLSSPFLSFLSLLFPLSPPSESLPLEVSPLNTDRGSGGAQKAPSVGSDGDPAERAFGEF